MDYSLDFARSPALTVVALQEVESGAASDDRLRAIALSALRALRKAQEELAELDALAQTTSIDRQFHRILGVGRRA